jgi:sulfur-oxidizing protein SoxX
MRGGKQMKLRQSHCVLATIAGAILGIAVLGIAPTSAAPLDGQKLAFDRSKGNCLTCHEIKGGDAPGNSGPALNNMKERFPNRADLVAIIADETKRNPQTVMPPFKRNLLLNDQEIEAIVDFLYTR